MSRSAFLFPGQGAQTVGMGQALAGRFPSVRRLYDEASALLGYDLADVCWNGPKERLDTTVVSQPALFVASFAALEALRQDEPDAANHCVAAAGLSLGEYTALAFAEALSFADGLRVVKVRGEAMQAAADATPGGMVSVLGLEAPAVEALCARSRRRRGRSGSPISFVPATPSFPGRSRPVRPWKSRWRRKAGGPSGWRWRGPSIRRS